MMADSFDNRYERNLQLLNAFLAAYRDAANALFVPLSQVPQDIYPAVEIKKYQDKLAALRAAIRIIQSRS
jgi:hypothetical protein